MDDPVFKQKYQKYKLRVKLWEKSFKKKHGRIPSKFDIKEASQEVKDSYKMYYKLKTSFLEDTLNDVLSDDGFDVSEMSQTAFDMNLGPLEDISEGPQIPLDISKLVDKHHYDCSIHSQDKLVEQKSPNDDGLCSQQGLPVVSDVSNSDRTKVLKEFESVDVIPLNKSAWGPHLGEKAKFKEKKEEGQKPNFKEKLFKNSSFSIRNPRKSFSKSVLDNTLRSSRSNIEETSNISNKEVLPDLETILLQKAKEQQAIKPSNPLLAVEKFKENIKTEIDESWLNRNAPENGFESKVDLSKKVHKVKENHHNSPTPNRKLVYGLTNLDMSKLSNSSNFQEVNSEPAKKFQTACKPHDSDSMVDDSEEESNSEKYHHIVKRRRGISLVIPDLKGRPKFCQDDAIKAHQEVLENADSNCNEIEISVRNERDQGNEQTQTKSKRKQGLIKKTSSILKSSAKATRKTGHKEKINNAPTKKRQPKTYKTPNSNVSNCEEFSEEKLECAPINPDDLKYTLAMERCNLISVPRVKQTDLEKAEFLAKKYITSQETKSRAANKLVPATAAEEKRIAAKRKLEEKVANGKLNENFVTINIQKKVFVRGKKTINYSKYKKKLWKHKKHIAALSGPNMDMGGCDGGTLKCFNCGQAGHFAQSCKIKGDSLLSLTAHLEEDESTFPTLEEAEIMASRSAVTVHSRDVTKMPQAPNGAIYNKLEKNSTNVNEKNEVKVSLPNSENDSKSDDEDVSKDQLALMDTDDDELENFDIDGVILGNQKIISPIKKYVGSKIPDNFLMMAGIDPNNPNSKNSAQFLGVAPLYDLNPDGNVNEATSEVLETLKMFGHTNFRKGQDRAIMRILSGMSTLVTLSTGSGKSLCYQLPAYLYSKYKKSITLVISPLVSLMEDQVTGIPHFLRAYCLHTNQTPQQKLKIIKIIADGKIDILLVSPEAVVAGERSTGFGSILKQLPPIAFACIDEAHCVSQWSHNFRSSYLMICKVLRQNLGIKCILGLTATATFPTRVSIINHLGIMDGEKGIISDIPLPENLILSVSKDENRDTALLQLLLSKRLEACHSIIIYCTRRDECERVAGYLRTCLQDCRTSKQEIGKNKRRRVNWYAEPYHAGLPASRRRTIQNAFMRNELRIVVATIAFGMGINKPDIRAIIHYNMPRNFESYVQEVGRAGRDNKVSHCHLFLDANGGDQNELKRHIYANSLDRHVIRKLLQNVFVRCSCDKNIKDSVAESSGVCNENFDLNVSRFGGTESSNVRSRVCQGHEIGFSIQKTVEALDIPEENISTLLCYMELDNRWCINVLSNAYIKAKVLSYGGPKYLKQAAKECPPLAMAIAMEIKNGSFKVDANVIEFSVIDIAAAIGWNSGVVKYHLKNLEWINVNGFPRRSPLTVNFYDLGFRIKAPGDFTTEEIDEALDTLYKRSVQQEHTQLLQLQYIFQGLSSVAYNSYGMCCNETFSNDRSDQLKAIIRDYFRNDYSKNLKLQNNPSTVSDADLESDVKDLINMYPENNFTGRNIARIFHGISSPNYPALIWYRCKFWRSHSKTDFNHIVQLANNVIVKRRT